MRWLDQFGHLPADEFVEMAARRLLPEVHALASSYGWSEKEILALSPARRRSYIALLGAH